MKVLKQEWTPGRGGQITSISKDREQLDATIQELAPKPPDSEENEDFNYRQAATPSGKVEEIDIPDDSVFADMVKDRTIFLHDDELDLIWDNLPEED